MEYIKLAFNNLPVAAWAAVGTIFGAFVALAATLVSNVGNNKRLKIQLEHDAKEKNIDRMNTLRKEVYLAAVGEISKATSYLSSLPSKDLSNTNISEDLQGLFVSAAKLSLVASTSTQKSDRYIRCCVLKLNICNSSAYGAASGSIKSDIIK